ncbi:MAG: S8 family serine peptidase [Bacteroidota bacterium]
MNNKNGIILCLHFFIGCFLFSTTACQETDTVQEINPTNDYVDAEAIEYDMENRAIEEEYVILLKESEETSPEDVILAGEESRPTPPQSPPLSGSANAKQEDKISLKIKGLLSKHKISSSALLKKNALQGGLLSLRLHPEEAESLSRDKAVEVVEKNRIIALNMAPLVRKPFIPSEADLNAVRGGKKDEDGDIQSYGTERVGGKVNFRNDPSWGHRMVWIVDTGIDKNHPDLHLSHTYSANFTSDGSYGDMVGHGTHVAGIIAAKDNGYGTVGIAAGARLASVKVLNKRGEGSIQNLMAGLSHVYTYGKPGDVVNISIGGSGSSGGPFL